ncbi:MAG: hypothetical protein ACE5EW_00950 [Thermoplasmata archaeon]
MGLMDNFDLQPLPKRWQEESAHWEDTYFQELSEVQDEKAWHRFYPERPVTKLAVIQVRPDAFGTYASKALAAGHQTSELGHRVNRAEDLNDAQFDIALRIIKAQASTELGSIQQHRMVYSKLDDGSLAGLDREIVEGIHRTDGYSDTYPGTLEALSFSAKRVCVEELRHHYQMAGVLTLDPTWDQRHGRRYATKTLDELFAMKPGQHILDAFNIPFLSLMDEAVFMALIDRVGKYQLEMQHHFLYAPMALSMPFMRFMEESYHLAAGERLTKAIAVAATLDGGNFGIQDLQDTINAWYPRGLEMFGSELSGQQVKGVFKTLANAEAQAIFSREVRGKVRDINLAIIIAKARVDRARAAQILNRVQGMGETVEGLGPEDLLRLPDRRFFRFRGLTEFTDYRQRDPETGRLGYVYLPYDLDGHLMVEGRRPIPREDYIEYLGTVLPERYLNCQHWEEMKAKFLLNPKWQDSDPVLAG